MARLSTAPTRQYRGTLALLLGDWVQRCVRCRVVAAAERGQAQAGVRRRGTLGLSARQQLLAMCDTGRPMLARPQFGRRLRHVVFVALPAARKMVAAAE